MKTEKIYFPWFVKDIICESRYPANHLTHCVGQGRLDIDMARSALYQLYGDAVTLEQQAEIEAEEASDRCENILLYVVDGEIQS